jgi:hypothetical protein
MGTGSWAIRLVGTAAIRLITHRPRSHDVVRWASRSRANSINAGIPLRKAHPTARATLPHPRLNTRASAHPLAPFTCGAALWSLTPIKADCVRAPPARYRTKHARRA